MIRLVSFTRDSLYGKDLEAEKFYSNNFLDEDEWNVK